MRPASPSGAGCWLLLAVLLACAPAAAVAAAPPAPPTAPPPAAHPVHSYAELYAALRDPSVSNIAILQPFAMPSNSSAPPPVVTRQLTISSPIRAMIDWCDAGCRAGKGPAGPFIILGEGAMVTFNRLFFRNFIPPSAAAAALPAQLDYASSPVPFIVSRRGGQANYNLVVMHWTRPMLWVLQRPGTFWHAAREQGGIRVVGPPGPVLLDKQGLYTIKSFASDRGTATITDCYMPFDVDGCLTDQPFSTTLIYCPYTFKDSLRNPWVERVLVFHDVGLDRLVNSYRNPAVVNRTVLYESCPGTRHTMDLDGISSSVLITAGGSLTFKDMALQGSKSQSKPDWPSNLPLLLSTFRPVESGTIIVRDSTVRVKNMDNLIRALDKLPSGSSSAVEVPDLQPVYQGGHRPKLGDDSFLIRMWQLQRQRWLLTRAGGSTLMDRMGSNPSWQFFNVTVESYVPPDCFAAAVVQGSLLPGRYSQVSTGEELLDQLANGTARFIRVTGNIKVPAGLPAGRVAVNRIVEVRACSDAGPFTVDFSNNHDIVMVSGNAIWEGDMVIKGIGWAYDAVKSNASQVVDALHPYGSSGIVEYEDLALEAEMPSSLWQDENVAGRPTVAALLGVPDLDSARVNMTSVAHNELLLRGFALNRSNVSGGADGLESFLDVNMRWQEASEPAGGQLAPGHLVAAIVVPIVVGSLLAGALVLLVCRRRARAQAGGDGSKGGAGAGRGTFGATDSAGSHGANHNGRLLPLVLRDALGLQGVSSLSSSKGPGGGSASDLAAFAAGPGSDKDRAALQVASRTSSGGLSSTGIGSRNKSGPSEDIAQACKDLAMRRSVGPDDELILESVLGEGSYGKVFKATWRGSVVAVKIMVLPSNLSGKEKREKMAVMETAISSSLSHPKIVATYTYAVEPVRANTQLSGSDRGGEGPGAGLSVHDSTHSWRPNDGGQLSCARDAAAGGGSGNNSVAAWEVRLVQEWCDLGSLTDAFKQKKIRPGTAADGVLEQLVPLVDTALDVARAMAFLHKHNVLHADLKARNVLLRSDLNDPRGYVAKVADFGLSLQIDPNSTHISNTFQGTMTHMAPEVLMEGHVSRASDVFAYGILLWELFTGEHAYKGVARALLGHNITKGVRPVFPASTPFEWQFLACRCWESDPSIRPSFDQILVELKRMREKWSGTGSSNSSFTEGPATPLQATQAGVPIPQPHTLLRLATSAQLQQQSLRLPSIADTSDTLPTVPAVDQAQQQQQQRADDAAPLAPMQQPLQHGQARVWAEEPSRDALVLLSSCDTTTDVEHRWRPAVPT